MGAPEKKNAQTGTLHVVVLYLGTKTQTTDTNLTVSNQPSVSALHTDAVGGARH